MFESITISRPYAKAVFDLSIKHQSVDHWHNMLLFATEVLKNQQVKKMFTNIRSTKVLASAFIKICDKQLDEDAQNFIKIMSANKRLNLLPHVLTQFIKLRESHEMLANIEVISSNTLSKDQLIKIRIAMEKRFARKIKIHCKIDKSIIAGLIIRTENNIVIDGSMRCRLERLARTLCS